MDGSFWVYILLCSDASYYTGVTRDVARRLTQHEEGLDERCYTFMRRPVELVYAGEFSDPDSAIRFEKKIKGWSRKKKQALIDGDWNRVRDLARE